MLHHCRFCAHSFDVPSDLEQHEASHQVFTCPQCSQEFSTAEELHAHVVSDQHGVVRAGRQAFTGVETADPALMQVYILDVNGNQATTSAPMTDHSVAPGDTHGGDHPHSADGFGGTVHSKTVTLSGGVQVYLPDTLPERLAAEDEARSRMHLTRASAPSRFIYPSTDEVAAQARIQLRRMKQEAPMNTAVPLAEDLPDPGDV